MDMSFANTVCFSRSWLAANCLRRPTHLVFPASEQVILFSILAALSLFPAGANASSLMDSYVKFNQKLASAIMQPYHASMGVQLESVLVEYQEQPVSFQYQLWRLRPDSVCQPLKNASVLKYSRCSMAASQFFRETCQQLKRNPTDSLLYSQYTRLYCNAAASYRPVVAQVRRSEPLDERAEKRQQCSILMMKASRTRDPIDIRQRDIACEQGD